MDCMFLMTVVLIITDYIFDDNINHYVFGKDIFFSQMLGKAKITVIIVGIIRFLSMCCEIM